MDCDWPPVCRWEVENACAILFKKVWEIEETNPIVRGTFFRWDKEGHLHNIRESGWFHFTHEIIFSNTEPCTANRFIELAKSQGGLQTILKKAHGLIADDLHRFERAVFNVFGEHEFDVDFGYRMRVGMK